MKDYNFLLDIQPETSDIFINLELEDKIEYTQEIKKGSYEPDFGEFVDRYITRDIMINSKQEFIEWLQLGTKEDLQSCLDAFLDCELYEYCVLIKQEIDIL